MIDQRLALVTQTAERDDEHYENIFYMIIQKMLIRVFIYKARQLHLFCDVQVFVTLRNVCMYPLLLLRSPDDVNEEISKD